MEDAVDELMLLRSSHLSVGVSVHQHGKFGTDVILIKKTFMSLNSDHTVGELSLVEPTLNLINLLFKPRRRFCRLVLVLIDQQLCGDQLKGTRESDVVSEHHVAGNVQDAEIEATRLRFIKHECHTLHVLLCFDLLMDFRDTFERLLILQSFLQIDHRVVDSVSTEGCQ